VRTWRTATGRVCWEFLPPGPGARPVVVESLAEVAMALHLSEQPLRRGLPVQALAALVVRGTELAGLDGIRELLDLAYGTTQPWRGRPEDIAAARRQVWTGHREQLCHHLAFRVGGGWPLPGWTPAPRTVTGAREVA